MVSKFGWIDFSENERRQMLDVVHLFSERETRDELGIGTIRDAFSDHFFPGTSTIQTRPKYMLLIPWMYLELERRRIPSAKIDARARKFETDLIISLLENGDGEGVIGREAKKQLIRLPSNIYWSGLGVWGIRLFSGHKEQYHRFLDTYYSQGRSQSTANEEADNEFCGLHRKPNWHPAIPEPPQDLMESASLKLTSTEADYLKERILMRFPDSFFAQMLHEPHAFNADFPWEHPVAGSLPAVLGRTVSHARNFSEVIHGAALYYNLMLSHAAENDDWEEGFSNRLTEWENSIISRYTKLKKWYKDIQGFWLCPALNQAKIPSFTKSFVSKWLKAVFVTPGVENLVGNHAVETLIANREFQLKGPRARLSNRNALNRWKGESGTRRLIYRWNIISTYVADILTGLNAGDINA